MKTVQISPSHNTFYPADIHISLCTQRVGKGKGKIRPITGHEGPEGE